MNLPEALWVEIGKELVNRWEVFCFGSIHLVLSRPSEKSIEAPRKGKGGCGRKLLMRSGDKEGYDSGVLGGRLGYLRPESSWT